MAKLSITASPSFKAKVGIPVAGGADVDVEFTFKHRTKKQYDEFLKNLGEKTFDDVFPELVSGWELDEAFTPENISVFLENYHKAASEVFTKYSDELSKARAKN